MEQACVCLRNIATRLTQHFFSCIANKGRLEALCVSNEGIIKDLQSQITGLEQKILLLEEERNALKGSQDSVNEYQTAQIKSLEMVRKVLC